MQVSFRIDARNNATPGTYSFQVECELLDSGMNPLGPLYGNVFDFLVAIAP